MLKYSSYGRVAVAPNIVALLISVQKRAILLMDVHKITYRNVTLQLFSHSFIAIFIDSVPLSFLLNCRCLLSQLAKLVQIWQSISSLSGFMHLERPVLIQYLCTKSIQTVEFTVSSCLPRNALSADIQNKQNYIFPCNSTRYSQVYTFTKFIYKKKVMK